MNKYRNQINKWLEETQHKCDTCIDIQEKTLLSRQIRHIQLNEQWINRELDNGNTPIFCSCCGYPEFNNTNTKDTTLCLSCNLWYSRAKETNSIIIDGNYYTDAGWNDNNKQWNGFGGSIFKYKYINSNTIHKTNNLWNGGEIPLFFRKDLLKDNAEWVENGSKESIQPPN